MRRHWPLLPIAALALALRLVSLDFGLPSHPHPDEWRVVRPAVRMARNPDADLHPGYFNYPAFQFYVLAASLPVADLLSPGNAAQEPASKGRAPAENLLRDMRIARRVTTGFGLATVLASYALGWLCGGRRVAVLAGLFLAIAPYHVLDSHYTNVDVPMTLWLALAVCAALLHARDRRWAWLLAAAVCLGLAAATKYTALAAAPVLPAACLAARRPGETLPRALASGAAALALVCVVFAAAAPYTFLDFEGFRAGLLEEQKHMGEGHLGFDVAPEGWIYTRFVHQLAAGLPFALGIPLYLLALGGVAGLLRRPRGPGLLVAAAGLPLLVVVCVPSVVFLRYLVPLLPFLAVAAGGCGAWLLARPGRGTRLAAGGILALVLAYTAAFTWSQLRSLEPQNGALASRWIEENAPAGPVSVAGMPWMLDLPAEYPVHRFNLERARKRWPEWLVVSGWYERAYQRGSMTHRAPHAFVEYLGEPNSRFDTLARFQCHYLNQDLYAALDPSFAHQFSCLDFSVNRLRAGNGLTGPRDSGDPAEPADRPGGSRP